ncbi:MAG: LacI family transcriptional regulator [Armatimonadetes bacterium]|nr:LacI family transcriptional regulator [Armatimonadota bacterium]
MRRRVGRYGVTRAARQGRPPHARDGGSRATGRKCARLHAEPAGPEFGPAAHEDARNRDRDDGHGAVHDKPFFCIAVLDGILEYAAEADYQVKVVSLRRTDSEYVSARLDDGSVDAVAILAPPVDGPSVRWAIEAGRPTVVVGSLPPDVPLTRIDVDDERALFEAVRWLAHIGHERIGIITGPPSQWSAVRRERAYARALTEAGLPLAPTLRYAGDYEASSGQLGASSLLNVHPRPTAIVCGNDAVAIGAMEALQQLRVRVPEDVSILGFDDHELAQWSTPKLTTIRQPLHEMGVKAAEILIGGLEGGAPPETRSITYPGVLVKRKSVSRPPGITQRQNAPPVGAGGNGAVGDEQHRTSPT